MKLKKFLVGVALCTTGSLFVVSCKKTDIVPQTNNTLINDANVRMSGVAPDDPAKIARVPVLISADFLNANKDALLKDPLSLNGLISSQAFRGGKPGSDRTAPTVSITTPANSSTVSGMVNIQVSAADNVGVTQVSASIDGVALSTSSTAPYTFSWNTSGVANGTHTISSTARDAAGNNTSTSIQVGINTAPSGDVTKPTVTITSPASGSSVSVGATVVVAVSASDNVGVTAVSFSVDGALQNTSSSSPYSFSWNTAGAASGSHTLTATAKDAAGNSASYSIMVNVNTTVITPPSLPSSFQLQMPAVGNQGSEGSCVSFAVGYAARSGEQFYKTGSVSYNLSTNIFSPEYLFNQTKVDVSCTSGSALLSALDFLQYVGICTWVSMPYSSSNGCSLLPNSTQNTEAANFKISSYSSIYTTDITSVKTMLSTNHPLLITFAVDQSFYNAGPGFIWSSYSSANGAGHAVAICGYDDSKHAVKIMNSWGTAWGDAGFIWIDYDFLPSLNSKIYVMNL